LFIALIGHHFVLECNQQVLDGGGFFPLLQQIQVLDPAIVLVDRWDVDFVYELQAGWFAGVVRGTLNGQAVDSILEVGLRERGATL
jgi:hypothetical protein